MTAASFQKVVSSIPAALALVAALAHVSFAHGGKQHDEEKKTPAPAQSVKADDTLTQISERYVKEVLPVFKRACFNCHSSQPVFPWYYAIPGVKQLINHDIREAREHMDMTAGFPFKGHGKPKEDLAAIIKSMEKGTMPPLRYRILHGNEALSQAEREIIKKWAADGLALMERKR
ncbi:MAG: heme-binding domain-containing protein [Nitrospinae bacterium]|nr:heme-binding domain-containing protein [Nitrospinota bacterium]